jgi:glycerol-3-phosphate acyltransferase PlsY
MGEFIDKVKGHANEAVGKAKRAIGDATDRPDIRGGLFRGSAVDGWIVPALVLLGGYLLGSVPFGVIVTRVAGAADPRTIGSGNIGATNVLRTGRKGLAAATLLLDAAKGAAAVLIAEAIWPGTACWPRRGLSRPSLSGLARLQGRQGRGDPDGHRARAALALGLVYARCGSGCWRSLRISSLAGMTAAISAPVSAAFFSAFDIVLLLLALALLVLWKHRENIERLLSGTEPRSAQKA